MNSDVSLKKCDELFFPPKYTERAERQSGEEGLEG